MGMVQRHLPGAQRRGDAVLGAVAADGLPAADDVLLAGIVEMIGQAAPVTAGIIRMQPESSDDSDSATQAVTCSAGSRWKYASS